MAPVQPQRHEKDRRLRSLLSFASELEEQLPQALTDPPGPLSDRIQKLISTFPNGPGLSATSKCEEIDAKATVLWNLCTRLRRNYDLDKPHDVPPILLLARIFAFLLLDCALENGKEGVAHVIRAMKVGIKAAKNCIDSKQPDLSLKVLEKLGKYELLLLKPVRDEGSQIHERLIAEYYVLRTALAWQREQLDVAEFMFNKSMASKHFFDARTAESLADVLYEIGKDILRKKQYTMAVKWLDRAHSVLVEQELDRLSMDASELRLSIMESLIKALLGVEDVESKDKARSLVELLENELGEKLIVLLLRLELISAPSNEIFDSSAYCDVLKRMIRTMMLTESNFKLIMHHIRKLADKNPGQACVALDELLKLRILPEGKSEWTEKVIITRLWVVTNQEESSDALKVFGEILSMVFDGSAESFTPAAGLAAQTLLWKRIESRCGQGLYEAGEGWCRIALHRLFEKSGEMNKARISRKLILCSLARQDISSARDAFGYMSEASKNEPMTRFLMYKVAIRSEDSDLAAECLQAISSSAKDPTLLYACVLDSQQVGNRKLALAALQLVLEKQGTFENQGAGSSGTVHLPSLLRVTISLTSAVLDGSKHPEGSPEAEANVEKLCKIFEGAVTEVKKARPSAQASETVWTVLELNWFSKNSYNLAVKNLSIWSPRHSLRMLLCCIAFINQYPKDIDEPSSDDLWLRKMFCEFSSATALVALARGENVIETQLQDYLSLRKHVESFDGLLQEKLEALEEGPRLDLLQKLAVLLGFDFEAACHLKAWDSLSEVILKAACCSEPRVYELMADCMLSSQAPTQVLVTNLKRIINEAWSLESLDSTKLAKYMRCLFQVALSDSPQIAEQLLDQVHGMAEEASQTAQPYPTEELEWIAARAFNHAVDLYCSDQDDACRSWAGKAFNVAHFCDDGGALERVLQSKFLGLKWDA